MKTSLSIGAILVFLGLHDYQIHQMDLETARDWDTEMVDTTCIGNVTRTLLPEDDSAGGRIRLMPRYCAVVWRQLYL